MREVPIRTSQDWRYARSVCLRAAQRYASRFADAEDIAQEAAIRAWRRRDSLRDEDRLEEWLARIARNEAHRSRARRRDELVEGRVRERAEPDPALQAVVENADVESAISMLTANDRELLDLRYRDDLTQAAVARRLGLPEGTVKVRLHRAREKLRSALAET